MVTSVYRSEAADLLKARAVKEEAAAKKEIYEENSEGHDRFSIAAPIHEAAANATNGIIQDLKLRPLQVDWV